ncbi:MAG: four helix bundle protein, partial [Candidatus Symbiothrix sp.]|nr:four helix bundle protein [Candidatus Symbiothrix sp.]
MNNENKSIKGFEDLVVWKNAMQLVGEIYTEFINNKDYGFRDQIQRS